MRKALVVVCVAASALLLAGGAAATTAGAEETPDVPGLPGFAMPEWPLVAPFGDGPDGGGMPGRDDTGDDGAAAPGGPAQRPGTDDPAAGAQAGGGQGNGGQGHGGQGHGAQDGGDGAPDRPVRRPAGSDLGFAQRPGTDLTTAARRDVTAADVSSSPAAPVQQQVLALVNQHRRRGGCDALSLDRRLIDAANEHAADMARRRYFAHESPNGEGAGDRVADAGYRWKRYGENIARGADSPYEVVDGWMHSPGHRENILDCRLHQMGVGLAIAGDDTPYWVQDFATPAG